MPAHVLDMRNVALWPASIYVDTSVLRGAFRAGAGVSDPKDKACASFIRTGVSAGCDLWTALLGVEEACWPLIRNALGKAASTRNMGIADLKRHHPRVYSRAYAAARPLADSMMAFLMHLGVVIRGPRVPAASGQKANRAICYAVRRMFHQYELEMADLFHIAFTVLDGAAGVATLDKGFRDVSGLCVYTVP